MEFSIYGSFRFVCFSKRGRGKRPGYRYSPIALTKSTLPSPTLQKIYYSSKLEAPISPFRPLFYTNGPDVGAVNPGHDDHVSKTVLYELANFLSAFCAPCKAPKYCFSISFLIASAYLGRLARRPKALKKFATILYRKIIHHKKIREKPEKSEKSPEKSEKGPEKSPEKSTADFVVSI